MSDFAIMPFDDYKAACDAVREATGSTDPIKSCDLAEEISNIPRSGTATVDPASEDGGPGTVSVRRANGFRIYNSSSLKGQLLLCPASPNGYEMNTSGSDEIGGKNNRNKALTPLFLDYAVTSATHQKMSDSYNPADATNDTPDYEKNKIPEAYRDYAGAQPVSYNAVKNYVDSKAINVYEEAHSEIIDLESRIEEVSKKSNVEPMFELIGSWRWEDIDMRLDSSINSAVQADGRINGTLEQKLPNDWTIIKKDPGVDNISRVARYDFPAGKAYKKVIAMMSFDPNYIPEGYITELERSRGFKEGTAYGQKAAGDPVYSDVYFLGDMGGSTTLLNIETHCKEKQGFVKILNEKVHGLWTLTRTERSETTGGRSDLRHYQSGYYGSYDIEVPVYHEDVNRAHHLGSYERITGFEFETILPWYYDEESTSNKYKLNNLRGYLYLYGIPEDDPEIVYGKKFYNITIKNYTGYDIYHRTKQYEGGVVSTTIANCKKEDIVFTCKGKNSSSYLSKEIFTHTNPGHSTSGVLDTYYTYVRFNMPSEDVEIIAYRKNSRNYIIYTAVEDSEGNWNSGTLIESAKYVYNIGEYLGGATEVWHQYITEEGLLVDDSVWLLPNGEYRYVARSMLG